MEKYRFSEQEQAMLERLRQPFAVYQFVDRRVVTLALSDGFCKLFGYDDRAEAYYDMDNDMYKDAHPDDVARIANAAIRFATEGGHYEVIYRTRVRDGSDYRIVHAAGEHVYTDTGVRLAQVWYTDEGLYSQEGSGLNQTLSSALREESLVKASQYDYLTGLPSMTYFFELADAGKESFLKKGAHPALLYMDFSGMKFFNTRHGFSEGDKLLRAFAKVLAGLFSTENCCHIGADHFAVHTEVEGLEDKLERMFRECGQMNEGRTLPVHVGVYRDDGEKIHASVALDRAKLACGALKGRYEMAVNYYSQSLNDKAVKKRYIIENLDRAIEERWIQVHYQPIIRAVTGKVCDEEALARWIDPAEGYLSPADFIPPLEEAGLIYKLDLYVVEQVLLKMKRQVEIGLHIVPHSVNLSRSDFSACDIVEEIRRRVDEAGIGRDKITVEITESVIGTDFEFMKAQVARFRSLGFPVWLDDFGSGYSSLDVLQSMPFDLIKFDMAFMRNLDEGNNGRIILTQLMKMATALGVDTVCEGVETQSQVRFLQEIGCAKLQGFYYCKAIPLEQIVERNRKGIQIGYENPEESAYFDLIGRVNLYDPGVMANEDERAFHNTFNTLPMSILEIRGDQAQYVRTSPSYRDFMKRFFRFDVFSDKVRFDEMPIGYGPRFMTAVRQCCETGSRVFFDEVMPDGTRVHAMVRKIAVNPVTGAASVAIAALSVSEPNDGATYADIARALAADYYNIYAVDLDTERFIEYSSSVGGEELAMERHGTDFFASARRDTMTRIYEDDREAFLACFTKEKVIRELDTQGVFTATYRLIDSGKPLYASMKITRMHPGANRIIMGISIVDAQMKEREQLKEAKMDRDTLARIMALNEDYIVLYTVDVETGKYMEYTATSEYESLGVAKAGEDFFTESVENSRRIIHPEDFPMCEERLTKENILREIRENGMFKMQYRLVINGEPRRVSLRIASVREGSSEKLVAGVRAWRTRK
ncbi:MAG: GGDEF and EAL domain-containing protein [Clostridia bacterium]|nr:GGDEF and EAL domain-containing protein [Clostridia bacterium]